MRRIGWLCLLGLACACGHDEPDGAGPDGGGPVLAEVNGVPITEQDFLRRVRAGGHAAITRARTKAGREAILESMIRNELLWQEAKRRGLRNDRQVRDAVNPLLVKRLLAGAFEKTVKIDQVDARDVERIYRERWDEFHFPEVHRLGVMKVRDRATATRLMRRLAEVHNNEDVFEMLASSEDNLDDHLRANEGNIGYLPMDKLQAAVPEHLRAAFERMKETDEEPEIVETPQGLYILMMTGHRPPVTRELADVREGLRQQAFRDLREKKLNEFVGAFRSKHDVDTHYDRLDQVPSYEAPRPPPPRPFPSRSRDAGTEDSDAGPVHPRGGGSAASNRGAGR